MTSQSDETKQSAIFPDSHSAAMAHPSSELDSLELIQIYTLIDSILPFEACLYYQVLPLSIEGSRLIMGTVNPDDPAAVEYVMKQLSYINYSIRFEPVASDWHRDLLSKYLNYKSRQRQSPPPAPPRTAEAAQAAATFILDNPEVPSGSDLATPSADSAAQPTTASQGAAQAAPDPLADERTLVLEDAPAPMSAPPPADGAPSPRDRRSIPSDTVPSDAEAVPRSQEPLTLEVDANYRGMSHDLLATLPPQTLMPVLLSKVLDQGIGRLYCERLPHAGRILWSRDGVLQAVIDRVEPAVLQGVINEFKLLSHLSLIAVDKPKQVELERIYEGQRILLRFRIMPGKHGEEATVQILRGTALRFYQQQQIDRLGRDALDAAQLLQERLNEIRDRARSSLNFQPTRSEILPTLFNMLKHLEAQIQEIEAVYDDEELPPSVDSADP